MSLSRVTQLEHEYVNQVLETQFRASSVGTMTARLETVFCEATETNRTISVINGTATLHAALVGAGIGPGCDVLTTPLTMSATTYAILQAGAHPVFVDVDEKTFNIDPDSLKERLTPESKAVISVSLYGLSSDTDRIMDIARSYDLFVLEDNAQALGATYKGRLVGANAHAASYSLQSSKHLTAGEGGLVTTNDIELADAIRTFSNLGYAGLTSKATEAKPKKSNLLNPDYDRHIAMGFNYRMPELCAAVALAQVERMKDLVEMRQKCAQFFAEASAPFEWLIPQHVPDGYGHAYWCYTLLIDENGPDWQVFADEFAARGGDPLYAAWKLTYLEPYFSKVLGTRPGLCPVAESIQPRLLQFKTNYCDIEEAEQQADILHSVASFFNRG